MSFTLLLSFLLSMFAKTASFNALGIEDAPETTTSARIITDDLGG